MRYKILLFAMLLSSINSWAQFKEESNFRKAFGYSAGFKVELTNKYGTVTVLNWEKDSIAFEVNQKIIAKSEEKLMKLKSVIDFEFIEAGNYVIAKTIINSKKSSLIKEIITLSEDLLTEHNAVETDYKVYIPKNCDFKLENKYGDVYLGNLKNNLDLELSYGDLRGSNIDGEMELELAFGDGIIDEINQADISSSFGELTIEKIDKLKLETRSGKVKIKEVGSINITSKSTDFNVRRLGEFVGVASFSDFEIEEIKKDVSLRTKYGSFKVNRLLPSVKNIDITTKFTAIDLGIDRSSGYTAELNYKNATVNFPKDICDLKMEPSSDKELPINLSGTVGKNSSNKRMKIVAENCTVNLKVQ